jgi:hypothetical protein
MKNSEWGAAAYLAYSPYGRNGNELAVNQCSNFYTGAGPGIGNSNIYNSTYTYNADSVKNFSLGTKIVSVITASFVNGTSIPLSPYHVQSDYILFRNLTGHSKTFSLVTKTVTDSELDITTTETYTYDQLLRTLSPKTVTSTNSDGKVFKTINVYPFECTSTICDSMYIKNYADQVVSSRQYAGDTFLKMDSTLYLAHNGWFYPYKQYEQRHGGSMFEKLQLCDYNTHGNPRTIIENQTDKTALIWSFNGAYPVARISGKTFAELSAFSSTSNKIGQVESVTSPRPRYNTFNPSIPFGNNIETIVDITVKIDNEKKEYVGVPSNTSIHEYGNVVITESRDAMISEVNSMLQTSK